MGEGGGSPFALKGLIVLVFMFGAMLGTTSAASATESPVAAYSFDEGEGEVAADAFGEHDGIVKGAAWTKGKYGSALKFNGSEEECVRIADSPDLRLSEELTIEAWVKPEGGDTSDPIIFKETGGNFTYALAAGLFHASTPEGAVAYEPNVSTETESPTDLTQNVWNHLALTYDGAYLRLYLDGELVDTEKSAPAIQTKDPLAIGCSYSWDEGMTGKIDEVRIYDRALDEGELGADKGAPIQTPPADPVAAYSFDAGEGTTLEDLSGEHDGTIEGATWTKGKYGSALHFDGINDLVSIPDSNELDLTDELTLEAWVRPDEANAGSAVITKERGSGLISYQMHAEGSGKVPVGYVESSKGRYGVSATTTIPVHVWSHLSLTYDGAKLRYYVNGVLEGTASAGDPGVGPSPVLIGGDIHWAPGDSFKGKIDEVRIYDRALDAEEAADLLAPRFREPLHVYAYQTEGAETMEIYFEEAEDPPLSDGQPGSGVDLYRYRTSVNGSPYTGWKESPVPYFLLAGVQEGDLISVQVTLRDRAWNQSGVYESTVVAPHAGPPEPGEYSPEEGAIGAPGGTCAAEPERSGCPSVEKIIVVPTSEESATPYGSTMSARGVPPGDTCAVMATYPRVARFNSAHTEGQNECLPGHGVIYTELFATLYKFQEDGELQFRGSSKSARRTGAGLTRVNHYSKCHGRTEFNWKAEAHAYTDVDGVGYFGTNLKVRSIPCN